MNLTEIKCPWCRSLMHLDVTVRYYTLECYNCGARGPMARTEKQAVVDWKPKKTETIYNEMCCGDTPWEV